MERNIIIGRKGRYNRKSAKNTHCQNAQKRDVKFSKFVEIFAKKFNKKACKIWIYIV